MERKMERRKTIEDTQLDFDKITCYNNCSTLAHPKVIEWICKSEQQFSQRNMNCSSRLQKAQQQHSGNAEIGFVGLDLDRNEKYRLYEKYKIDNNINFKDVDRWEWLSSQIESILKKIDRAPDMGTYWSSHVKDETSFMRVFKRACRKGNEAFPTESDGFEVQFHDERPVDVGVYNETLKTLFVHRWAIKHFRRCDIVLLAFHEILGHHHGEKDHTEKDAMDAEMLVNKIAWTDPYKNSYSLLRCVLEWKLFRLVRAQVDLRLHSPVISENIYTENAMTLWSQHKNLSKYVVPIEDETVRVAALPVQSQTYL
jgi:hypothetical protein